MKTIIQVVLVATLIFYGIHFNVVRDQDMSSIDELNTIISGLETRNEKLEQKITHVQTRSRVRDYFDVRGADLSPGEIKAVTDAILKVSNRYQISPELILALIETESSFDKNAISEMGAVGLMQVLPSTAADIARDLEIEWKGAQLLHDPGLNIEMGAFYLNQMLERFKDLELALAAYNMGPNRVARLNRLGYEKPERYYRKVYRNLESIEKTN